MIRSLAPRTGFGRDSVTLVAGSLAAQLIGVAAMPVLTRIYDRADLGLLGAVVAVTALLAPLACLRYEQAAMLVEAPRLPAVLQLSLGVAVGMSLLAALLIGLFGDWLSVRYDGAWIYGLAMLAPPTILALGVFQTLQVLLSRRGGFTSLSVARVARTGAEVAMQLGLWWTLGPTLTGLVIGHLFGILVQAVVLAVAAATSEQPSPGGGPSLSAVRSVATRYRSFPRVAVLSGIASVMANHGFTVVMAVVLGPREAGLFYLAHRVLGLPVALVSQSIGPLFYQRLSAVRKSPKEGETFIATAFLGLLILIMAPTTLLVLLGPQIFAVCFGAPWSESGEMVRYLWPGYVMMFCAMPLTHAFYAYEKQAAGLCWQVAFLLLRVAGVAVGFYLAGTEGALVGFALVGVVMYAIVIVCALSWSGCQVVHIPAALNAAAVRLLDWGRRRASLS